MQGLNWMMYTVHGGVTHARDTWCPFTGNSREQHVPVRSRLVLRVYDLTLRKNDAIFSSPNKHPSLSITPPPISLSLSHCSNYIFISRTCLVRDWRQRCGDVLAPAGEPCSIRLSWALALHNYGGYEAQSLKMCCISRKWKWYTFPVLNTI